MKRLLGIVLLFVILICASAVADESVWAVREFTDEFGDPTGEKYVVGGPFIGTFSNTATTDSKLEAYVFCYDNSVFIRLLEYGDYQVNNPFSKTAEYQVMVKATLNNYGTTRFNFKGGIPQSGSDIIVYNKLYADNYSGELGAWEISGIRYESLLDVLKRSSEIKFAIRGIDSSMDKYNFSIANADGLSSMIQKTKVYEVSVGTKVLHEDWGEGVITRIHMRDGKKMADIDFESRLGANTSIQIPWAFEAGRMTIIE